MAATDRTETRTIHGIPVIVSNTRPDIQTVQVFRRLTDALDLIATYDPRRFRRLRHDLEQMWVRRYPCRAAYFPEARACLIELTFVGAGDFTAAQVASSVVHEGMHARLSHMGVGGRREWSAREERRCRMAELEFGLAIPDGDAVVARARETLALPDAYVAPTIDWHEATRRVLVADRGQVPISNWVTRLLDRLRGS